jgi:hypothetical protein
LSGRIAAIRSTAPWRCSGADRARNASHSGRVAFPGPGKSTGSARQRKSGASLWSSASGFLPRKSSTVKSTLASTTRKASAASRAVNRVFRGTRSAPLARAPRAATIQVAQFGAHTATQSPGWTSRATRDAATPSISSRTSTKLTWHSPSTMAGRSPNRSAACNASSGIFRGTMAWAPSSIAL